MPRAPVTGGDLHVLWKITHTALPQIENVYNRTTEIHSETLAGGDAETFGRAYPVWQLLQQEAHEILYNTAMSVYMSRAALLRAMLEYTFADADNAEGITEAGEGLKEDLNDPGMTKPWMDVEVEGEAIKPEKDDD